MKSPNSSFTSLCASPGDGGGGGPKSIFIAGGFNSLVAHYDIDMDRLGLGLRHIVKIWC